MWISANISANISAKIPVIGQNENIGIFIDGRYVGVYKSVSVSAKISAGRIYLYRYWYLLGPYRSNPTMHRCFHLNMNFYFMMAHLIPHRTLDWQNMNITPISKTYNMQIFQKFHVVFCLATHTYLHKNIICPQMPGLAAQLEAIM